MDRARNVDVRGRLKQEGMLDIVKKWQQNWKQKVEMSNNRVTKKNYGDTKRCYTYVQIGKNLQLPVAVLLKVSHFLDDVTRGTVRRVNVLQMRISATLVLYSGSETLAYRR